MSENGWRCPDTLRELTDMVRLETIKKWVDGAIMFALLAWAVLYTLWTSRDGDQS